MVWHPMKNSPSTYSGTNSVILQIKYVFITLNIHCLNAGWASYFNTDLAHGFMSVSPTEMCKCFQQNSFSLLEQWARKKHRAGLPVDMISDAPLCLSNFFAKWSLMPDIYWALTTYQMLCLTEGNERLGPGDLLVNV